MNDEAARHGRPDTSIISAADDSRASGERRPRVPCLYIEIPYEGRVTAAIRGARDEQDAAPLRAWLETDPELREFCRLALRIRDRMAA